MRYHFSSRLTATLNLCLIYFKITWALAILLEHLHKKFEMNQTKINGRCRSGRKVVIHNSQSDFPLARSNLHQIDKLQFHFFFVEELFLRKIWYCGLVKWQHYFDIDIRSDAWFPTNKWPALLIRDIADAQEKKNRLILHAERKFEFMG